MECQFALEKNKDDSVETREDFIAFVDKLVLNYKEHPDSWPNNDLETYLSALAGWVEDMDGYYLNQGIILPENPNWQMIANMLSAAKVYE